MNTDSIRSLLAAIKAKENGNEQEALSHLSAAIGAKEPTEYMKDQLSKLLEPNEATLILTINEAKK